MKRDLDKLAAAAALSAAMIATGPAAAQKQGGILRAGHFDSPASMSMVEESTLAVNRPMMGIFNNLVMFDQQVTQNSPQSIVPDNAPYVECCSAGEMTNLQRTNFSLTAAASIF